MTFSFWLSSLLLEGWPELLEDVVHFFCTHSKNIGKPKTLKASSSRPSAIAESCAACRVFEMRSCAASAPLNPPSPGTARA